jgi:hypothetical protein
MELWLRFAAHASVGRLESYDAVYRRHAGNMSLDYTVKTWLPDLKQRKAAFDCFFQTCSNVLPDAERLRRKLLFLLACDAVGFASTAFNERKMEASQQLSEYALELCPGVKGSMPWMKFVFKRRMGYSVWHAFQSAVAKIRK